MGRSGEVADSREPQARRERRASGVRVALRAAESGTIIDGVGSREQQSDAEEERAQLPLLFTNTLSAQLLSHSFCKIMSNLINEWAILAGAVAQQDVAALLPSLAFSRLSSYPGQLGLFLSIHRPSTPSRACSAG